MTANQTRRISFLAVIAALLLTTCVWTVAANVDTVRDQPRLADKPKLPREWVWDRQAVNVDSMYAR